MIEPHTVENDKVRTAIAWVVCPRCNNARHRVMPGEKTPWWFCQDEKEELAEGQEIEIDG